MRQQFDPCKNAIQEDSLGMKAIAVFTFLETGDADLIPKECDREAVVMAVAAARRVGGKLPGLTIIGSALGVNHPNQVLDHILDLYPQIYTIVKTADDTGRIISQDKPDPSEAQRLLAKLGLLRIEGDKQAAIMIPRQRGA